MVGAELARLTVIPPAGTGSEKITPKSRCRPAPRGKVPKNDPKSCRLGCVTVTGAETRLSKPVAEAVMV